MWQWILERLRGRKDPSSLESLEDELHERLQNMGSSLARLLVEVKRLGTQVESKSERVKALEERMKTYRRIGREQLASELDGELVQLQREVSEDKKELESARTLYSIHQRKTDEIRSRLRERARELERLRDQTALKELQIEIDSALADASREVEGFLERAKSLESDLGAHHDQAAAKARVARDLADLELNEDDQREKD